MKIEMTSIKPTSRPKCYHTQVATSEFLHKEKEGAFLFSQMSRRYMRKNISLLLKVSLALVESKFLLLEELSGSLILLLFFSASLL